MIFAKVFLRGCLSYFASVILSTGFAWLISQEMEYDIHLDGMERSAACSDHSSTMTTKGVIYNGSDGQGTVYTAEKACRFVKSRYIR